MKAEFQKRRDYVLDRITRFRNVTCLRPDGAFYAFMNVSAHFGRTIGGTLIDDSTDVLHGRTQPSEGGAGDGLGVRREGYARLSFATSLQTLEKGFDALERFLRGSEGLRVSPLFAWWGLEISYPSLHRDISGCRLIIHNSVRSSRAATVPRRGSGR